jgi:hypothetical protein
MKALLVGLGIAVLMAALAGCEDDPRDLDYMKDAGAKHFDAGHFGSSGSGGTSAGSGGSAGSTQGGSGGTPAAGSGGTSAGSGGSAADQDAG